jgi:hypothetical protein
MRRFQRRRLHAPADLRAHALDVEAGARERGINTQGQRLAVRGVGKNDRCHARSLRPLRRAASNRRAGTADKRRGA